MGQQLGEVAVSKVRRQEGLVVEEDATLRLFDGFN